MQAALRSCLCWAVVHVRHEPAHISCELCPAVDCCQLSPRLPPPPSTQMQARSAALGSSEEAETWAFLATHFAADGRRYLLERLGFTDVLPPEPEPEAADAAAAADGGAEGTDAAAAEAAAAAEQMQQMTLEQQAAAAAAAGQLLADDGADFFDKASPQGASLRYLMPLLELLQNVNLLALSCREGTLAWHCCTALDQTAAYILTACRCTALFDSIASTHLPCGRLTHPAVSFSAFDCRWRCLLRHPGLHAASPLAAVAAPRPARR